MNTRSKTSLFLGLAFLVATTSSVAGELSSQVTPAALEGLQPIPISWSIGDSKPLASYKVQLTNESASATKKTVRFVATASAIDADGNPVAAKVVFDTDSEGYCTADPLDDTSIECGLPELAPGESSKQFTVSFVSPTDGKQIWLDWLAVFDNGDSPGLSNGDAGDSYIPLAAVDPDKVTSHIPAAVEVTFSTGSGVATRGDPWVTRVNVPAGEAATTAKVQETPSDQNCPEGRAACSSSSLTIPGSFPDLLEITLLLDASKVVRGAKISDAVVYYRKTESDPYEAVPPCAAVPAPESGKPCEDVTQRYAYPKKSSPRAPVPTDFLGDWRFVIYALDNGRIVIAP